MARPTDGEDRPGKESVAVTVRGGWGSPASLCTRGRMRGGGANVDGTLYCGFARGNPGGACTGAGLDNFGGYEEKQSPQRSDSWPCRDKGWGQGPRSAIVSKGAEAGLDGWVCFLKAPRSPLPKAFTISRGWLTLGGTVPRRDPRGQSIRIRTLRKSGRTSTWKHWDVSEPLGKVLEKEEESGLLAKG